MVRCPLPLFKASVGVRIIYYLKVYAATVVAFLAIDFVWLAFVARGFDRKQLGFLLADQPNWYAAGIFYLLFVGGIVVFVIAPALQAGSLRNALLLGGFFGLVTYATYDLTNARGQLSARPGISGAATGHSDEPGRGILFPFDATVGQGADAAFPGSNNFALHPGLDEPIASLEQYSIMATS